MSGKLPGVFEDLEPGPWRPPVDHQPIGAVVMHPRAVAPIEPAHSPIPIEWADQTGDQIEAPIQIVEGVLTEGAMSVIYGESNSGKTYLALHLGICVCLGEPWLGRRTTPGRTVIYIAAEGPGSVRMRLAAFHSHYGRLPPHFGLIPATLNLMDPSVDVENLIDLIRQKIVLDECPSVALIIVDTVAQVMGGANENASEDMARLVAAGARLKQATGAHVMFIHHSGKDAAKGARGHSSLRAAVDTEIEVTADESTRTHTAKITKQRDLPSKGERIAGRFISVELGRDQWGNPITACAVIDAEATVTAPRPRAMSQGQQAVMGYLLGQAHGVRRAAIVAALESQGINRATLYRAIKDLIDDGKATDTAGMVYVPKQ